MKILLVHNNYGYYSTGGEKNVMLAESKLLKDNGHEVIIYECTNNENVFNQKGYMLKSFYYSTWNPFAYRRLKDLIKKHKPDIMHVHNYWYQLSPSIFKAAYDNDVPSVITLHNYRLLCPGVLFLRNGKPCEDCLTKNPIRSIFYRCHSNSLFKTILSYRLFRKTKKNMYFSNYITGYIALSNFAKSKFIQGGIKKNQLKVKSNFIPSKALHSSGSNIKFPENYALYVGRISNEKGIESLCKVWHDIDYPLIVIGEGEQVLEKKLKRTKNIIFLGQKNTSEVFNYLKFCSFLVFPSIWYEGFPLTIIEAFSMGKPVVATNLGSRNEVVIHEETGLLFDYNNITDFKANILRIIEDKSLRIIMGINAKRKYENEYSEKTNLNQLLSIYNYFIKLFNEKHLEY